MGVERRKARVLFVEHSTDGTVGGSHYCLLEICRALDRSRFEPVVRFFQTNPLVDEFRQTGAEVIVAPPTRPRVALANTRIPLLRQALQVAQAAANAYVLFVQSVGDWRRELRRLRIDIVHLNNSFNGDHDLILAAHRSGIPCIAHQRGVPGNTGRLELAFARLLDRLIAISTMIRDDLIARGAPADRIRLIHDGIDPERIVARTDAATLRSQLGIPKHAHIIGIVGNVKYWKGQHVVIDAMKNVSAARRDVHCLLVGALADAPYVEKLRAAVKDHGLEDRVHFIGYQRNPADFMSMMDVVLHASVEPEPFGLVVVEAMALRKPLIATTIGGPRDVVEDGVSGFLTPPGDAGAMAARILQLLGDDALRRRMGEAAIQRLRANFTAERNVRQIENMYSELLAPG